MMFHHPSFIVEPRRETPVGGEYDVVVVGGGMAGVAAAVAAARNGASTCLVENQHGLGGLATLGLVVVYLPLCDGRGRQVIAGLGEELLKLSLKYGPGVLPDGWKDGDDVRQRRRTRYRVEFNPASLMLALEEVVLDAGVRLAYDSRCCGVHRCDGARVDAVLVENKSGRMALRCGVVVDATGDADVAQAAGEPIVSVDTRHRGCWFYSYDGRRSVLHKGGDPLYSDPPEGARCYAVDNWRDVTQMDIDTRKLVVQQLGEEAWDRGAQYPLMLPLVPQFRMTRRLSGAMELDTCHDHVPWPDTVGLTGDWRRPGPVFAMPYRCLTGSKNANLLTAGRCIAVTGAMWDITRVIPACVMTGEAAGTAAAMASRARSPVQDVDVPALQTRLERQGVILEMPCQNGSDGPD